MKDNKHNFVGALHQVLFRLGVCILQPCCVLYPKARERLSAGISINENRPYASGPSDKMHHIVQFLISSIYDILIIES